MIVYLDHFAGFFFVLKFPPFANLMLKIGDSRLPGTFWKRVHAGNSWICKHHISTTNNLSPLAKNNLVLLMVEKSQGQPPGMYKTFVNHGINYSTFPSTGDRWISSINTIIGTDTLPETNIATEKWWLWTGLFSAAQICLQGCMRFEFQ